MFSVPFIFNCPSLMPPWTIQYPWTVHFLQPSESLGPRLGPSLRNKNNVKVEVKYVETFYHGIVLI